jgi:hypothetical protein
MVASSEENPSQALITERHVAALRRGFQDWPRRSSPPPALGDRRWTADLILATWTQAETGLPPADGSEYRVGASGGGFDRLEFRFLAESQWLPAVTPIDLSIPLNRRPCDPKIDIPIPWYGAGMSFGSVSEQVMVARVIAA